MEPEHTAYVAALEHLAEDDKCQLVKWHHGSDGDIEVDANRRRGEQPQVARIIIDKTIIIHPFIIIVHIF